MGRLVVLFALPFESAGFRRSAVGRRCHVVHGGVGAAGVARALDSAVAPAASRGGVEAVLVAGFCGALHPAFPVGLAVVGEASDGGILRVAKETGCSVARVVSVALPVESAEAKARLRAETGGDVVDMESAAAVAWCRERGVPVGVVRVVSDGAGEGLPVPFGVWIDAVDGGVRVGRLGWHLAGRPWCWWAFAGFVGRVVRARRRLTDALGRVVSALPGHSVG